MGYVLSKYDDVRLKDNPVGVEARRESFILTYDESNNSMEFKGEHLGDLIDALTVLKAYEADSSLLRPPSEEIAASWRREEDEELLLEKYKDTPLDELRWIVELRGQEDEPGGGEVRP